MLGTKPHPRPNLPVFGQVRPRQSGDSCLSSHVAWNSDWLLYTHNDDGWIFDYSVVGTRQAMCIMESVENIQARLQSTWQKNDFWMEGVGWITAKRKGSCTIQDTIHAEMHIARGCDWTKARKNRFSVSSSRLDDVWNKTRNGMCSYGRWFTISGLLCFNKLTSTMCIGWVSISIG